MPLPSWSNEPVPGFDPFADRTQLPRPSYQEDFDDLETDETSPDFYGKRIPFGPYLCTIGAWKWPTSSASRLWWCPARSGDTDGLAASAPYVEATSTPPSTNAPRMDVIRVSVICCLLRTWSLHAKPVGEPSQGLAREVRRTGRVRCRVW